MRSIAQGGGRGLALGARPSRASDTVDAAASRDRENERTKQGPVTKYVRSEKKRWKGEKEKNTERATRNGTPAVSKQDVISSCIRAPRV